MQTVALFVEKEVVFIHMYMCVCVCMCFTLSLDTITRKLQSSLGLPLCLALPVTRPGLCDTAGVLSTVCWGRTQQPGEMKESPALHPIKGQLAVPCDPQTPGPDTTEIPCRDGCRCWER